VPQQKNLVSIQIGAKFASVSEKTIRRYISSGDLTGYRLGKKLIRVDLDEINQLLKRIPAGGGGDAA
jgi:excisionase family DNA binding protein